MTDNSFFGTESIGKILIKIAPPVMLAQLIMALYNIVDSFFVGRYSDDALTAVTVVYPMQIIIIALSVGTGVGVNIYMARKDALGEKDKADGAAGTANVLAFLSWAVFAVLSFLLMRPYVMTSATGAGAIEQAVIYGNIVCVGSVGTFFEASWSKIHQARGNMRRPMAAQVAGALTNVMLDPVLIFGLGPFPEMGIAGAAYATVIGQAVSAVVTFPGAFFRVPEVKMMPHYIKKIYVYGYSSIAMEMLFTVYIFILNTILATFSDSAVTVLGLYYKSQNFFFIPLIGLQTCIVPVISYNFARKSYDRCRNIMRTSLFVSLVFMVIGIVLFVFFPETVMRVFSKSDEVIVIGKTAFPIIGVSFISAVFSLMLPVFFQAIGRGMTCLLLMLTRQIFVLVPSFYLFSKIGLSYTWLAFPIAETTAGAVGLILYIKQLKAWRVLGKSTKAES